jgi:hypothetical protein
MHGEVCLAGGGWGGGSLGAVGGRHGSRWTVPLQVGPTEEVIACLVRRRLGPTAFVEPGPAFAATHRRHTAQHTRQCK